MTDNSVETRRLKEYFDIELLREKQHSEYVIDRLKKKIRKLEAERDEARQEAKKWRDKALYQRTVPALISPLPWEADHA